MTRHTLQLTRSKFDCLPSCMEPLAAVVVAQIADTGHLLHANLGFHRLTQRAASGDPAGADVRHFFINPSFADLLAVHSEPGEPVFEGILNVVDQHGVSRSLIGTVHHFNQQLMLVAEYDVADMERLNAQVIELNDELCEVQRDLARANRSLRANEERLRQLSITDPLTGLANRRHLMDYLEQAWQRSQRFASTFSVIMADIDFFKKINDQHGHEQGDVVLKAVSAQLRAMVRKIDLAARFGGEEFVIVLQEAPLKEAVEMAERLRQAVTELVFEPIPYGISCSYGVAQLGNGQTIEQLLKNADDALYQSKHSGRNRVTAWP